MLAHQTLPLPAATTADQREQGTTYQPPRSIISRFLFAVGLCRSGAHFHQDTSARAMCCDGWRFSTVRMKWDDQPMKTINVWRAIDAGDMRFPWEGEPCR